MFPHSTPRLVLAFGLALVLPAYAIGSPSPDETNTAQATSNYQSMSLQPGEVDALRRKVLVQCGIDGSRNVLPWYFHFAYGQALLEAGDARRAVAELSRSIDLKPEPQTRKRTYGMWFTDYLPYFQLAEAHARLNNWPCAERAMQLSQSSGEAASGGIEKTRIRALQERIDSHVDDVGACNIHDYQDDGEEQAGNGG
jgi:hypothetical protein